MSRFAAAITAAAAAQPMSNGDQGTILGRLLLADGDGLAYYCAGNEECAPGQARANLLDKLRSARAACGAERVKILLTGRGSHKGFRFAVARVKPYQGHRDNKSRPRNWDYLRSVLEQGDLADWIDVEIVSDAEADDLFARYAAGHPDCVIYTQDKDMRMVAGWHLDWMTHILFRLEPGTWRVEHNEKVWGRAWFWSQMLHGDTADNIPGLPFYINEKGTQTRVGEKAKVVVQDLAQIHSDMGAILLCQKLYRSCYGERWLVEMVEQGILLWMRNDATSSALNVLAHGNPMHQLTTHELWPAAKAEVMARIAESVVNAEIEDHGSGRDEDDPLAGAGAEVQHLQAAAPASEGGARPRPLDGGGEGDPAQRVQQPAREDREQPQEVRRPQPAGIPSWRARLLAKA